MIYKLHEAPDIQNIVFCFNSIEQAKTYPDRVQDLRHFVNLISSEAAQNSILNLVEQVC